LHTIFNDIGLILGSVEDICDHKEVKLVTNFVHFFGYKEGRRINDGQNFCCCTI